jgi:hypothetical protein
VASAQTELRATAFSYALLGALFFAFGVMLIAFSWTGSWSRLWDAVGADCSSVASFGATAILLWVLAALSLRFLALNRIWQLATFAASLLIALWNIGGAVRQTLHPFVVSYVPGWSLVGAKWLLALAYSICSYSLWKHRASNNRWRGP